VGGVLDPIDGLVRRWVGAGRGGEIAIAGELESGARAELSFKTMLDEVERVAGGLQALGVRSGDRVAIKLPMVVESVIALLACAATGAIAVPLFSGFGGQATAARLRLCEANVLVGSAGYERRGRWIDGLDDLRAIAPSVPSLRGTVVVGKPPSRLRSKEVAWQSLGGEAFSRVPRPAEAPLLLAFTSGTTGAPKGITLPTAGFLVKTGTDMSWLFNVGPGKKATWVTDPGWIMAQITVIGTLVAGGSLALLDGAPNWPSPQRLWKFVDGHGVSMLGLSPTLVRTLMTAGNQARPRRQLLSLEVIGGSGETWSDEAFNWLFESVGMRRVPIINYSGGTEVSGGILSNTIIEPIVAGRFAGPVPGMAAGVSIDDREAVPGEVGELVLRQSSPGLATTFWNDHPRYLETYWNQRNTWQHGDLARAQPNGPWEILGRSDDTMKVAGKRIGPGEVEAIANDHPGVRDSAAVAIPDPTKGEAMVVFVCPARYSTDTMDRERLAREVSGRIATALGRPFRPHGVAVCEALPRTRSGKIMRRVVRSIAAGNGGVGDLAGLDNPDAIGAAQSAYESLVVTDGTEP
jgi:acetyl-CoA synthetase